MKKITSLRSIWLFIFAFFFCLGTQAQEYNGDLTLSSQAEVNSFSYTEVTGSLSISGSNITDLSPLSSLTSVKYNLKIINNVALTSLTGLESLTSVGGELVIRENVALTNLMGLENLTSVSEDIEIKMNDALTSLTGLENITNVPHNLDIILNTELTDLTALEKLTSIGGIFHISGNNKLTSLTGLENITTVKHLYISGNSLLPNLTGLDGLTEVTQYLEIDSNPSLTSLVGLESLSSVASNMWVVNNDALVTLTGLENLAYVGGNLSISSNAVLTKYCALYRLISQGGPTGSFGVVYNEVNPTRQEILDNCMNKPPTATCQNITVPADENCQTMVTAAEVNNGSTDPDGDEISLSIFPEGPYSIGVTNVILTVDDGKGETAICEATVTVEDDMPPVITCPADVTLQCPADISIAATGWATATDACDHDVTITSSDVSVPGCGNTEVITRTWTATDECGNSSSAYQTIKVIDEIPPLISGLPDEIVQENDLGECGAIVIYPEISADDYCQAEVVLSFEPASGSFFPVGTTLVSVTAADACGNSASASFPVTIENQLPVLSNLIVPIDPVAVGTPVSVSLDFEDDNLTEVLIDWGDGNQTGASIDRGVIMGEYAYSIPGVYVLKVEVKDACGEEVSLIHQYIVIYDPDGGFVTGGGRIYSPAGAYKNEPLLEGNANFGFVSKYKKGSTVPDGNTEFQFKAGNLNFKSTEYEWLVISGSLAQFKGSGTINGFGNYGFLLSATDADLTPSATTDKFRIKIWNKADDLPVYDNNIELEENSEPSTEISGGSIVIHTKKTKSAEIQNLLTIQDIDFAVFPNPFNDRLHFEFSSPVDIDVRIEVYDVTGRKVQTVFDNKALAGTQYRVDFLAESKITGFYVYSVKLGKNIFYDKAIQIKK